MKKNRVLSVAYCILLVAFFCGCAAKKMPLDIYPEYALTINGAKYLSLIKICGKENISWDYDAVFGVVTLTSGDIEAKLMVDSQVVLAAGMAEDLGRRVELYKGEVIVPYSFHGKILNKFFQKEGPVTAGIYPRIKKICLDAGHGGKDPGAVGRKYGLREKNINLDIVMRMKKLLREKGIDVVTTRASDVFIPLDRRADIANRSGVDLFISVHTNASKAKKLSGFEVYYIADNANDAERALELVDDRVPLSGLSGQPDRDSPGIDSLSRNMRAIVWDLIITQSRYESAKLAGHICRVYGKDTDIKILGVKGARFAVLKKTEMPAVLVEIGFISNANEERYLKNSFYRQQIAEALVGGILAYNRGMGKE